MRRINPLIITYTGTLKSKNTNIPFIMSSTKKTTQARVFNIMELRSCLDDNPKANSEGIPRVKNAPAVITCCTLS